MLGLGLAALPQKLLAEAVGFVIETIVIVAITWHYVAGYYEGKNAVALAQAQAAAQKQYTADVAKYNDIASQLEQAKAHNDTVYNTITREIPTIVDRPVYLHDCMDADGLRLTNAALAGTAPASAAIAASAVSAASAASGNNGR